MICTYSLPSAAATNPYGCSSCSGGRGSSTKASDLQKFLALGHYVIYILLDLETVSKVAWKALAWHTGRFGALPGRAQEPLTQRCLRRISYLFYHECKKRGTLLLTTALNLGEDLTNISRKGSFQVYASIDL